MISISKPIVSFVVMLLCISNALAQDPVETPEPSDWEVLLQLDNDVFAGSDHDYTNGVRVGFVQEIPLESDEGQRMDKRLRNATKKILGRLKSTDTENGTENDASLSFARGVGITQLMFTPQDPLALRAPEGEGPMPVG